ncbi:MAG: PRC-barrel domain-containing protein [Bacteroidales bacterium]|nr:PRC-barrel domain-containing protein [Bacteroidales bacterium]
MLQKDNFVKIGKIKKKVGKGNEYVMTLSTNLDIFSVLDDTLFVDINGCDLLPVFPELYSEQSPRNIKIRFNDMNNNGTYLNKDVYVPKDLLNGLEVQVSDMDLIGWNVYDTKAGYIGKIVDTIVSSQQAVLIVSRSKEVTDEIMIPLHEDLIDNSNIEEKSITFNLPDGLLDINDSKYETI